MNNNEELFSLDDISKANFQPSILDILMDEDNNENLVLYNENGEAKEFEQIALIPLEEKLYVILKPVNNCLPEVKENEAIVFVIEEFEGETFINIELDEEICETVFEVYYALLDAAQ